MGRSLRLSLLVLVATALSARADSPDPKLGLLEGRIVGGDALTSVEGATVVVTDEAGGPVVASGTTTPDGWFHYRLPSGTYQILAMFGESRWIHQHVKVETGRVTQVPGVLAVDPTEVITVHEKVKKEHRPAHALPSSVKPVLPYSEQAMNENIWAVGWMLLDVDETGVVTAFRFLHRPGHDLEVVAEREVWNLRFEPARDDAGKPTSSKVLWKFEWPPFFWAKDHKLMGLGAENALTPANHEMAMRDAAADGQLAPWEVASARPTSTFLLPDGVHLPPCRGKAPLNLENHEAVYRDCTAPDLTNVNTEKLITRPDQH